MDPTTIFIGLTTAAVVLQAGILIALYLAVRKIGAKVESLATEVQGNVLPKVASLASDMNDKVLPAVDTAHALLIELKPKIEAITDDVSSTSAVVRAQVARIDAALTDIVDRTRLQVIRADEIVGHTMDRIEETGDMVRKTVVSPVRHISGVVRGVSTGFEVFFGAKRRRRNGNGVSQDEMFI
ncbi:MAG: hypothetical protein ACRD2S_05225 [Terriglobales bacterium]